MHHHQQKKLNCSGQSELCLQSLVRAVQIQGLERMGKEQFNCKNEIHNTDRGSVLKGKIKHENSWCAHVHACYKHKHMHPNSLALSLSLTHTHKPSRPFTTELNLNHTDMGVGFLGHGATLQRNLISAFKSPTVKLQFNKHLLLPSLRRC